MRNKAYDQGYKSVGATSLFITRGLACVGLPVKFNCQPTSRIIADGLYA